MCLPDELQRLLAEADARDRLIARQQQVIVGGGDQNNDGKSGPSPGADDGAPGNSGDYAGSGIDKALADYKENSLFNDPAFNDAFGGRPARGATPPGVPGLPGQATPATPSSVPGLPDPLGAIDTKTPSEQNATATRGNADDTNYGGKNDTDPTGSTGSPAGSTAAQSPDQDNTGGMGIGSTANSAANPNAPSGEMSATGTAPGVGSGQNETSAGPGNNGGGGGGGGNGSSGPGTGAGQNDSGHGVGGSQGSENGQGGYMMGTADTGDDGDMMPDEEVDGPIHENEAVLPEDMRNDIGKDILAEAISFYQDKGLTPRERKAALKDLLGEWASK